MPTLLLSLLGNVLPDIIKRVLPGEKISETDQANLTQQIQLELLKQDWDKIEAEYKDRDSARNLAAQEIAKGNAWTSALAAVVRPLWGIGCFALVAYSVAMNTDIKQPLQSIIEMVLMFYFGGRVIEKVVPHIAEAMSDKGAEK